MCTVLLPPGVNPIAVNKYLPTPWSTVLLEKTNWLAASQEIPRISRNQKVHYCTHKRPPLIPHVSVSEH